MDAYASKDFATRRGPWQWPLEHLACRRAEAQARQAYGVGNGAKAVILQTC